MNLSFPSPEFDNAVSAVCHGSASEEELAALNELLRVYAPARDEYLWRLELHSRLASEPDLFAHAGEDSFPPLNIAIHPALTRQRGSEEELQRRATARRRPMRWAIGLAACFLLIAAGVGKFLRDQPAVRAGSTSTAVAMLIRSVDAQWDQTARAPRVGGALAPGWLRLKSGLAQIVFYSGARVVIEGPAQLQLISANEGKFAAGRLLAEVPEPARGFRLNTDRFQVVDLGTSFGLDMAPGRAEVHVFKGQVELQARTWPKQALLADQAAVIPEGDAMPQLVVANASGFAAMFDFQRRSLASEAFCYERWQFGNAQLNEDPSLVVHLDFENLSGADWTLRNSAGRNPSVPSATTVGCVRGEGRWREKQALEFQSVNDRVRLAVPGEFDALTLSAWVCLKGLDRPFNSLFMCDGFEPGTIHWLIREDSVLGLTVFGPRVGKFQIMASPAVSRLEELGVWQHLAVVLDGKARQVVHYLNGDPISRHALTIEPPFRIGAAELGNWNAQSGAEQAPFLVRNLSGSFDEFALFSRALSDAEIRELHARGKPEP